MFTFKCVGKKDGTVCILQISISSPNPKLDIHYDHCT